jgi:regulator of sirC expression with transglutaminase-like and TPR domain
MRRNVVRQFLLAATILAAILILHSSARCESLDAVKRTLEEGVDPLAKLAREVRDRPDSIGYLDLSLQVAREIYPDLNEQKVRRIKDQFRALGVKLKTRLRGADNGDEKVKRVNAFLFGTLGLRTALSLARKEPPSNYFPHEVLRTRRGLCLGITLVYLELCEHAGVPVYPVHAPQHIYVRYDDGKDSLDIETTKGGRLFKVGDIVERYRQPREKLEKTYFHRVGKLDVLGDLLNAAAWCSAIGTARRPLSRERNLIVAELAVAIGPNTYNNWDTLAEVERHAGKPGEALTSLRKALDLQPPAVGVYDKKYWLNRLKTFTEAVDSPQMRGPRKPAQR